MMKTHENGRVNATDEHLSALTRTSKTKIEGILRAQLDMNLRDEEIQFALQTMKEEKGTDGVRQKIETKARTSETSTKIVEESLAQQQRQ